MKNKRPEYILGTGLSHDGSACLLKDGKIAVAIEKERITRSKHDGGNDNDAIKYCLDAENIKITDVDLIVQCGGPDLFLTGYNYHNYALNGDRIVNYKRNDVEIVTLSHHMAHAYYAIATSPFEETAVLIIDGNGQEMKYCMDLDGTHIPENIPENYRHLTLEKDSFYHYSKGVLTPLYKDFSPFSEFWRHLNLVMLPGVVGHSIGDMYERASNYCLGKNEWEQSAGKLMGLAPYGRPGIYKQRIYDLKDGRLFVNYDWQKEFDRPFKDYKTFKADFQYYADIAWWVQSETERAIFYIMNERAKLCQTRNLSFSGGVALNAVANAKIRTHTPFTNIYLTPAAGDNGLSIGCAYYGWLGIMKKKKIKHNGNSCFGKTYSGQEIEAAIKNHSAEPVQNLVETLDDFFDALPQYCIPKIAVPDFKMQIIINDVKTYSIESADGKIATRKYAIPEPDRSIRTDGYSFIALMLEEVSLEQLWIDKKLFISGDVTLVDLYFDKTAVKEKLQELKRKNTFSATPLTYSKKSDSIALTAHLLNEGNVIGWFQQGSEFGPRSLGRRSILADPRKEEVRDYINLQIKLREDFRPFAPSVLLGDVATYFMYEEESPYMILVVKIKDEWKDNFKGVVHQDNSCRIQTVTPEWNEKYYSLLSKFKEITGVSVLLNTSFNRRGTPIVETPEQALKFFMESELDYLVMDDYIFYKDQEEWNSFNERHAETGRMIMNS